MSSPKTALSLGADNPFSLIGFSCSDEIHAVGLLQESIENE